MMNLYIYISVYRGLLYHQEYHNLYLSVPQVLLWQIIGLNVTDLKPFEMHHYYYLPSYAKGILPFHTSPQIQ